MTGTILLQIPAEIIYGVLRGRPLEKSDPVIYVAGDFNNWDIVTEVYCLSLDRDTNIFSVGLPKLINRDNFMFKLFLPGQGWFVIPFFETIDDTAGNCNNVLYYNSLCTRQDSNALEDVCNDVVLKAIPNHDDVVNDYVEIASIHELSSAEELLNDSPEIMKSVSFTMNDTGTETYSYLEGTPQDTSMGSMSHSTRSFGKSAAATSLHALAFKVRNYFK